MTRITSIELKYVNCYFIRMRFSTSLNSYLNHNLYIDLSNGVSFTGESE
jgi:small nuclear ribonucleoprotein (snRNP)-like protein